jgi:hypothetical protein
VKNGSRGGPADVRRADNYRTGVYGIGLSWDCLPARRYPIWTIHGHTISGGASMVMARVPLNDVFGTIWSPGIVQWISSSPDGLPRVQEQDGSEPSGLLSACCRAAAVLTTGWEVVPGIGTLWGKETRS